MKNFFYLKDIRAISSQQSFTRGRDYYDNGMVEELKKIKGEAFDTFECFIFGTYRYKVTLKIIGEELNFSCTCPYDYSGICKHKIAMSIAILNGEYEENHISNYPSKLNKKIFLKEFKNANKDKKISFLKQILEKNSDLQSQFLVFINGKSDNLDKIIGVDINKLKDDIYNKFSSLNFNNLEDKIYYNNYNDYYDDYEAYHNTADNIILDAFDFYVNKSFEFLKKGNLLDAFRIILSIYEGTQNLPDPEKDENEIFCENYNDTVKSFLLEKFSDFKNNLIDTINSDENILEVINLVIDRFKHHEDLYSKKEKNIPLYSFLDLRDILMKLIVSKKVAKVFYNLIKKNNLEIKSMVFIILKISKILEDEKLWLKTAKKFAHREEVVAKELLEKYKEKSDEKSFNILAKFSFKNWANKFDFYLINNLNKETELELYISALKNYVIESASLKYYKKLREYLNEKDKNIFIKKIQRKFYVYDVFHIQILEFEKRYKDILEIAKKEDNYSYNFEKIIEPIINIFPDECISMVENRCLSIINSYDKNRKIYKRMVQWMKEIKKIKEKEIKIEKLFYKIYNRKPSLPALKDEMIIGKII